MITMLEARTAVDWPAERNAELEDIVAGISDTWEMATGRLWLYRENYNVTGASIDPQDKFFWLPLYPLTAIALSEYGSGTLAANAIDIDPGDFQVDMETGTVLRLRRGFWLGFINARITGGYTVEMIPPKVKRACVAELRFQVSRFSADIVAIKSKATGKGSSVTYMDGDHHPLFVGTADALRRETV